MAGVAIRVGNGSAGRDTGPRDHNAGQPLYVVSSQGDTFHDRTSKYTFVHDKCGGLRASGSASTAGEQAGVAEAGSNSMSYAMALVQMQTWLESAASPEALDFRGIGANAISS
jgi:hypothetical protein